MNSLPQTIVSNCCTLQLTVLQFLHNCFSVNSADIINRIEYGPLLGQHVLKKQYLLSAVDNSRNTRLYVYIRLLYGRGL